MTDNRHSSGGHFVASSLAFLFSAVTAFCLLIAAAVAWLAAVLGSLLYAVLIVGGFFALVAVLIYLLAIHRPLQRIREQAETVYEVARRFQAGYDWVMDKVRLVRELLDLHSGK